MMTIRRTDAIIQEYLDNEIPEFKTNGTGLSMIFSHFSKRNMRFYVLVEQLQLWYLYHYC